MQNGLNIQNVKSGQIRGQFSRRLQRAQIVPDAIVRITVEGLPFRISSVFEIRNRHPAVSLQFRFSHLLFTYTELDDVLSSPYCYIVSNFG